MKTLRFGNRGPEVKRLQQLLQAQGFFSAAATGNFFKLTLEAVLYFQQTHLGQNGKALGADGIVGARTWWALENPSGEAQRSGLPGRIPGRLTPRRKKQLEIAVAEHDKGVHEVPDGSNWGPEISKYGGQKGWAWCCLFWSWCNKECFEGYALKRKYASCQQAWIQANLLGMWRDKAAYTPIPGDAFVLLYRNEEGSLTGRGHIGFVLRAQVPAKNARMAGNKATKINTVEGNCGNRVKIGERDLADPNIVGFINPFPADEQPHDWQKGLVRASAVEGAATR
jgi:hypothetical protein